MKDLTAKVDKRTVNLRKLLAVMTIVVIAVAALVGFWVLSNANTHGNISLVPVMPPLHDIAPAIVMGGSPDIHNLNAQILVNTTYTQGYKGYLTAEYPRGIVATNLIITARSPGNSTLTLSVNGTYILRDFAFANITTQNFVTPASSNETFLITIHSGAMNFTRVLAYYGIVYTPLQFINYESALTKATSTSSMNVAEGFLTFAPAAGMAVFVAQQSGFFARKSKSSRPNLNNDIIGGTKK